MPPRQPTWRSQTACRRASDSLTGSSRAIAVDHQASQDDPPPSLHPRYRASPLPRDGPPLCPASVLSPSRISRLGFSLPRTTAGHNRSTGRPRARDDRFARSASEPGPSSRRLHAGHHLGSKRVAPRLIPRHLVSLGFDVIWISFDTSSADRFRSPSWPSPDALVGATFPQRSAPRLLTGAPCGGLRPPPAGRPRRIAGPTDGPSISDAALHQSIRSSTSSLPPHSCSHTKPRSTSPSPSARS